MNFLHSHLMHSGWGWVIIMGLVYAIGVPPMLWLLGKMTGRPLFGPRR